MAKRKKYQGADVDRKFLPQDREEILAMFVAPKHEDPLYAHNRLIHARIYAQRRGQTNDRVCPKLPDDPNISKSPENE